MIYNNENFPSLPSSWDRILVDHACNNISVREKIQAKQYKSTGQLAIIDQGANFIGGYTDDTSKLVTDKLPVIVFGDHTRVIKFINFLFAAGADGIKVLEPKEIFLPHLFYHFLRAIKLLDKGYARHFQHLRTSYIAVPPLNEQKRIADKLGALLARVDACRERLDHIPAILKRFRQAVLAAATSGKLTEEWRDETESQIGWSHATIGTLLTDIRYGTSKKCYYEPQTTPVLRIPNIIDGKVNHKDMKYAEFDDSELRRLTLVTGDILMIRSNGSISLVGRTALVSDREHGFLYAGYLIRLRLNQIIANPEYVSLALSTLQSRNAIELVARSTSGVNNINTDEIKALKIPLPGIEEQKEIVHRVETLFAYADRLEARYTAARAQVEKLTPALLAKAFRGELVPQDPNDEPASALLERIRSERTNGIAKPR